MFTLYSGSHICILVLALFTVFTFFYLKIKLSRFFELFLVALIVFLYIAHFLYYLFVHGLHPGYDLPIFQLCGIVGVNLALFFYFKNQIFYSIVYLLGFAVSLFAFLLPDLRDDFMYPYFWMFWIPHFVILSLVSIVSFGYSFRLTLKDLNKLFLAVAMYLIGFALPMSLVIQNFFGYANYGYTLSIPFDFFGTHLVAPLYYPFALGLIYIVFRTLLQIKNLTKF